MPLIPAEAGGWICINLRPAWSTEFQDSQGPRNPVSKNKIEKKQKGKYYLAEYVLEYKYNPKKQQTEVKILEDKIR